MAVDPEIKRAFVEQIREAGRLPDGPATERLLAAFAAVPREAHVNPGPWLMRLPDHGLTTRRTPDASPEHLYQSVLIALDEDQGINIGEPSMWARFLARTAVAEGSSILQVGAGSGYYTAILAELAGSGGHVLAMETDEELAAMAAKTLRDRANVIVRHGNGATDLTEQDGPFDLIVAFAGVTNPVKSWINRLSPDGRMLLPVTGDNWWGAMILAERKGDAFEAVSLGPCGFFPCLGARDEESAKRVARLWSDQERTTDTKIRITFEHGKVRYQIGGQIC